MSTDVDTIREALYVAARGPDLNLSPVPRTPIGDAHLALDALERRVQELEQALRQVETAARDREMSAGEVAEAVEVGPPDFLLGSPLPIERRIELRAMCEAVRDDLRDTANVILRPSELLTLLNDYEHGRFRT